MRILWLVLAASAALAAGLTEKEETATYAADLGPAEVDVSGYPPEQRDRYRLFKHACAQCHTLARAINSPISTRRGWERYIRRMKLRGTLRPSVSLSKEETRTIVEFLTYDGKRRKIDDRERFEERSRQLQERFRGAVEERMRRLQEGRAVLPGHAP